MLTVNLTEAKNNLSRYVKLAAGGTHIRITVHGRVVAELRRPGSVGGPDKPKDEWTQQEWREHLDGVSGVHVGTGELATHLLAAPPEPRSGKPTSEQVIEERQSGW